MRRILLSTLAVCSLLVFAITCRKPEIEPSVVAAAIPPAREISVIPQSYAGTYVDKFDLIVGRASAEDSLLNWASAQGFNTLTLYSLNTVLTTTSLASKLPDFIAKSHSRGFLVTAVCGGQTSLDRIHLYNSNQTDLNKRFNAYNLELEWWNGAASFATYSQVLSSMRAKAKALSPALAAEVYIGWLKPVDSALAQADTLVKYCDRILVHDYRLAPDFNYMKDRLTKIGTQAQIRGKVQSVIVLYSSEKKSWGASNDFMGNYYWINGQNRTFQQSYNEIVSQFNAYRAAAPTSPSTLPKYWVEFNGYQIFTKRYSQIARPQ